jgi:tetratricopeptide (TPR) repeat protein
VLGLRAMLLQAQKKGDEAAALLEARYASLEKDKAPDEETMGRKILELLVSLGQLDAAERVALRLAARRPTSACPAARILAQRGKLAEALKQCQAAADAGSSVEAGTTATFLVSTMPPGPEADARLKQADAVLTTALKQNPDHFGLLFAQANVQRLQGRYTDAANSYRSMLARNPKNAAVLNNMAWTLSEDLDQPNEGLEKIDEAIQVMGRNPSLLDTRGVILTRLGKFDEAIKELEAAAATGPSPAIYYHLARAYHKAGQESSCQKDRALAKQAGLAPSHLQPHEREEMDKLMNHH